MIWYSCIRVVEVGDFVQQDEEVATIETDKVDVTVNSPASGTIVEVYAQEEDNVAVGADFFKLELGDAPKEGAAKPQQEEKPKEEESKPQEESKPAPESKPEATPAAAPQQQQPSKPAPAPEQEDAGKKVYGTRNETRVKMNRMRTRIAERLKQSQETAASLTTFNEIDMTNLMNLRKEYKDAVIKKHGVKFGFMSAFVKASATALQELPAVNAYIEGNEIVYHDYVDISVAVSTPKGLVTPVLRNVEDMNFVDIEKNIASYSQKVSHTSNAWKRWKSPGKFMHTVAQARDGKITIEDMAGGTFTISNGGVFGSLMGTPIINLPQTAILGMHAIKERPVVVDGKVRNNLLLCYRKHDVHETNFC